MDYLTFCQQHFLPQSGQSESLRINRPQNNDHLIGKKVLPADFVPSPYTVIVGRGKHCAEACGSRRLRIIASMYLGRYIKASTKDEKSDIVSEILATVVSANPNKVGAFVQRRSDDRWYEVDSGAARQKIGQLLRDLLHTKYRSSAKHKVETRRRRRAATRNSISSTTTGSTSSTDTE